MKKTLRTTGLNDFLQHHTLEFLKDLQTSTGLFHINDCCSEPVPARRTSWESVGRTRAHKGAHEFQSSKLNRAIVHKVFIIIVIFIHPCAN